MHGWDLERNEIFKKHFHVYFYVESFYGKRLRQSWLHEVIWAVKSYMKTFKNKKNVDKADCRFWNGHKGKVPLAIICQADMVIIPKIGQVLLKIYQSITSCERLLFLAMWRSVYVMLFSANKLFSMTERCSWTERESHEDVCDFNLHAANEGHSEKHSSVGG